MDERALKKPAYQEMLKRPAQKSDSLAAAVSACVSEKMNAATSFHKLHLKITGPGSYAAHKALDTLYEALPGHADDLAEGFQGASQTLLSYTDDAPRTLNSVADAIHYIEDIVGSISDLQTKLPYSELVNQLDNVKTTLNSARYKLIFLK